MSDVVVFINKWFVEKFRNRNWEDFRNRCSCVLLVKKIKGDWVILKRFFLDNVLGVF